VIRLEVEHDDIGERPADVYGEEVGSGGHLLVYLLFKN
jgi:hypothetical protein